MISRWKKQLLLLPLVLMFACSGAARSSFTGSVHDVLAVSQVSYTNSLETIAEAHASGALTEGDYQDILDLSREWQRVHNEMVYATQEYLAVERDLAYIRAQMTPVVPPAHSNVDLAQLREARLRQLDELSKAIAEWNKDIAALTARMLGLMRGLGVL